MFRRRMPLLALIVIAALLIAPVSALAQDLPQTYTSADGLLTFSYPEGWAIDEQFGTILIANSADAIGGLDEASAIAPGQVVIAILPPTSLTEQLGLMGIDSEAGPQALIESYIELLGPESFESPEPLSAGDNPVVRARGTDQEQAQDLYAIDLGEAGLALAAVVSAPGEQGQFDDDVLAILATLQAEPAAPLAEAGSVIWQQVRPIAEVPDEASQYGDLSAVAVGPDDTIYALDMLSGIHVFEPDGTEQGVIAPTGFDDIAADLTVGEDGTLWLLDYSGTVTHLDAAGATLGSFSITAAAGAGFFGGQIAFGPDDNLYVLTPQPGDTDEAQIGLVSVVDQTGQVVRSFEVGRSDFYYDALLAFGPDGNLYVADVTGQSGVQVFDAEGNLIREGIGATVLYAGPSALTVAPDGSIYVAAALGTIYHFGSDGTLLGRFGESQFNLTLELDAETFPVFEPGQFYQITGLAALSDGDVIVTDYNPSWVQIVRLSFDQQE